MKKNFILSLLCFTAAATYGQSIGIGTGLATPVNKLEVVSAVVPPASATICGTNTGTVGSGVYGVSHAAGTNGVQGTSNFGIGVYGSSTNNTALDADAITGTAAYATSLSGIALKVSGNLFFGNTGVNSQRGAVMTCIDAVGNAQWKPKKIGFLATGAANTSIPISTFRKVEFGTQQFDEQNNFEPYAGSTVPTSSIFTAPKAGIYHFESSVLFQLNDLGLYSAQIRIVKNNSGTVLANYEKGRFIQSFLTNYIPLEIKGDFHLDANDKVWIEVAQRSTSSTGLALNNSQDRGRFSGYLKIAD